MDGEKPKLVSKDGEYLCPLCLKKGEKYAIMAYQLNLYEAFYNCSNLKCHFPTFSKKYYVRPFQRHYLNMHEPIRYPQVYYGPLPQFEGVMNEEDEMCTDDEEEELIQNFLPEKKVLHEKINSEEVDDLLNDILQDLKETDKKSQQVCPVNILAGIGTSELTPLNHSEPNYNSSEKRVVSGESPSAGQKTLCSSESSHNASGMFNCVNEGLHNASEEAVNHIKQQHKDSEVPRSVDEVFINPSDVSISFSTLDISQTCELSERSNFFKKYSSFSVRETDQRMDDAASHLTDTLRASDHSYCKKGDDDILQDLKETEKESQQVCPVNILPDIDDKCKEINPLPTSFAPFEFTYKYKKPKVKRAARKTPRKKK